MLSDSAAFSELLTVLASRNPEINPKWILFLKAGICGGFTTFSTFALETTDLIKGDEGNQVKKLQKCLNRIMHSGLTVDGIFGDKTLTAVKAFQKKYKLVVDGIVGAKTRAKIKSLL